MLERGKAITCVDDDWSGETGSGRRVEMRQTRPGGGVLFHVPPVMAAHQIRSLLLKIAAVQHQSSQWAPLYCLTSRAMVSPCASSHNVASRMRQSTTLAIVMDDMLCSMQRFYQTPSCKEGRRRGMRRGAAQCVSRAKCVRIDELVGGYAPDARYAADCNGRGERVISDRRVTLHDWRGH